jgi:hypothetical protein
VHARSVLAVTVDALSGTLLAEGRVVHVYDFRGGLVSRMDVEG